MRTRTVLSGLIGLASILLVGCDNDDSVPLSTVSNVILSGGAAKGIINLGNVVAEELNVNGTAAVQVGSSITGIDGQYRLTLDHNYSGGPIRVTVSADTNTQMKCDVPTGCGVRTDSIVDNDDAIDFGEWYKPGSLTMTALVAEAKTGDSLVVNVTPYTHLAASRAMEAGSLNAARIYNANSEVSNLLGGIDILNIDAMDITDDDMLRGGSSLEIVYAAFSSAIAALADTSGGNPDIDGVFAVLSNSFSGGMMVADDGGMDDNVISLQEIINGAKSTLARMGITDTSGKITDLQTSVDEATALGRNIDPQPSPITGDSALARVKAFVSDMRTWGIVIEEETRIGRSAFMQQAGMASAAASASYKFLTGPAFSGAFDAIVQSFSGAILTGSLTDYTVGSSDGPQFSAGIITNTEGIITIIDGVINGVTVNMVLQLPANGLTASSFTLGVLSASLRSEATDVDINYGTITLNTAIPYTVNWMVTDLNTDIIPRIASGSLSLDIALTQKLDAMGVRMVAPVTFAGDLDVMLAEPVGDGFGGSTWATSNSVVLGGSISDTAGNRLDANLVANTTGIGGIGGFLPLGPLSTGSMGLAFTLQLAGLPEASVNISSSRAGFYESGDTTIVVNYGLRQIIMNTSYSGMNSFATANATGSMIITNQDGVSMTMENDFKISPGGIAYNGQVYGNIVHLNNGLTKIIYTDGTFEIL